MRFSTRSTTWSRTPGSTRPSRPCFEAYYELYKKGYILKGTPGLDHIQSQTAWAKGKALFIPNGSWVENESANVIPADFNLAVSAPAGLDCSDKLPFGTIWASGGEPFIVPAKAKNPDGRHGATAHHAQRGVLEELHQQGQVADRVQRRHLRVTLTPGLTSGVAALRQAGENVVNPRLQDWYVQLQKEKIGVVGPRRDDGRAGAPAETIKKIQGFADAAAKDTSIKHYKHQ